MLADLDYAVFLPHILDGTALHANRWIEVEGHSRRENDIGFLSRVGRTQAWPREIGNAARMQYDTRAILGVQLLCQLCIIVHELFVCRFAGNDEGDAFVEELDGCLHGGAVI